MRKYQIYAYGHETVEKKWWQRLLSPIPIALFILLVLAVIFVRPAYRALENWRADQLIADAAEKAQEGNDFEQLRLLRVAFQMAPWKPEAQREIAKYYAARDNQDAVRYFFTLYNEGNATRDDLVALVENSIKNRQPAIAIPVMKELAATDFGTTSTYLLLQAQLELLQGNWNTAIWSARKAYNAATDSQTKKDAAVLLAEYLYRSPKSNLASAEVAYREADILLERTEQEHDSLSALLLRASLLTSPPVLYSSKNENVAELANTILQHPECDLVASLQALDLLKLAGSVEQPDFSTAAHEIFNQYDSQQDRRRLLGWLYNEQAYQPLAALLNDELVGSDAKLLEFRVLAELKTGNFREAEALLNRPGASGIDNALTLAFRAEIAELKGDTDRADELWSRSAAAVRYSQADTILSIVNLALAAERFEYAARVCWRLAEQQNYTIPAYLKIIEINTQQKNTPELREAVAALSHLQPDNLELKTRLLYLNLLLERDVALNAEKANDLLSKWPDNNLVKLTAALGQYKQANHQSALDLLNQYRVDIQGPTDHGELAVYCAIVKAAGQAKTAQRIFSMLDPELMLPEEYELLES